jgi:putative ABC transport system ATP-binding protein
VLELRHLVKEYPAIGGAPIRAVDDVSMMVEAGEFAALYGPSGSGKTTLLLLIAGVLRPDAGSIHFDDLDVGSLSRNDVAEYRMRDIGIIRQDVRLLPGMSALDNASLKLIGTRTPIREAHQRVEPLLERMGMAQRLLHREHQLSMGERQRVMIARALSTKPRLLLADEPTGSLDTKRSHEVLQLLKAVCREHQAAMLMVTHDPRAADVAGRVYELRDGGLVDYSPVPAPGR